MSVNLISVEGAVLDFGKGAVLDGVSLGVEAGARIGVVGRNGGGKSTLLAVLAATQLPDSGRVTHKMAGPLRNQRMLEEEPSIGLVVAFLFAGCSIVLKPPSVDPQPEGFVPA